jgi:hypothetical protein
MLDIFCKKRVTATGGDFAWLRRDKDALSAWAVLPCPGKEAAL